MRLRQLCAGPQGEAEVGFAARWRARLVPTDLLRGQWPVRVLVNDAIFWLVFIGLLVVLFNPGHAVLLGRGIGLDWPGMKLEKPKANDCVACHLKRDPAEAPVW